MGTNIKFDAHNYRRHNDRNKKLIKKSLEELGAGRSILLDAENEIVAGNGVFEQAKALKIPVKIVETDGSELIAVKRTDLLTDDDKRKKLAVMDNSTSDSSEFDIDLLSVDFSLPELKELGVDILDDTEIEEAESKYTRKVSLPIYEIQGEEPKLKDLFDTSKADELVKEIDKTNLDNDIKEFFKKTATRFYEFDYGKIAEFYCHQDKKTQEIMEKLALVLIDFNKAVENGYVELNQFIENCFLEDKDAEDDGK